jgi:hypothetical protein
LSSSKDPQPTRWCFPVCEGGIRFGVRADGGRAVGCILTLFGGVICSQAGIHNQEYAIL